MTRFFIFSATLDGDTLLGTVQAETEHIARARALGRASTYFDKLPHLLTEDELGGFDLKDISLSATCFAAGQGE